jgi:Uma2 family endonuclease
VSAATKKLATYADLERLGDDFHGEVIHGVIVEKAAPFIEHGAAQFSLGTLLGPFRRRGGGGPASPGGWWFGNEVDVEFGPHEVYRPDVAGWRRERMPTFPKERPLRIRPDWVCEVLSESNARHDLQTKLRAYHDFKVPHYWIVDPARELLTVHAWREEGYVTALVASRKDRVRAVPFDAIEIFVGVLFGDDPDEPQGPPDATT